MSEVFTPRHPLVRRLGLALTPAMLFAFSGCTLSPADPRPSRTGTAELLDKLGELDECAPVELESGRNVVTCTDLFLGELTPGNVAPIVTLSLLTDVGEANNFERVADLGPASDMLVDDIIQPDPYVEDGVGVRLFIQPLDCAKRGESDEVVLSSGVKNFFFEDQPEVKGEGVVKLPSVSLKALCDEAARGISTSAPSDYVASPGRVLELPGLI